MDIYEDIAIVDLGLYLKKYSILVISDTQLGYEESLNKQGFMIPRFQENIMLERLDKIIKTSRPKTIIINGDIKHEFGTISQTEWRHILRLIDFLSSKAELILIRGNHDKILGPIADKKDIKIEDHLLLDDVYLCHGHVLPKDKDFKKAKIIIIGHEHPAIALRDSGRVEKYKCFLKGTYKDKALLVLPSFNLLTEGTDILSEKLLSPFLKQKLDNFDVYVAGEEILYFGKVKNLIK